MAAGTIIAGIGAATGAAALGTSIVQGKEAKKAAEKAETEQKSMLSQTELQAKNAASGNAATNYKQEQIAKRQKAESTAKITERQKRQGQQSLLSGGASGSTGSSSGNFGLGV